MVIPATTLHCMAVLVSAETGTRITVGLETLKVFLLLFRFQTIQRVVCETRPLQQLN
jgi:hypothetical protein